MSNTCDEDVRREAEAEKPPRGLLDLDYGDKECIITARGTEDGLVLRIDGRADWSEIISDLEQFLGKRRKFLKGGQVSIEWLDRLPAKEQTKEMETMLRDGYGIEIVAPKRKEILARRMKSRTGEGSGNDTTSTTIQLFDAIEQEKSEPGNSEISDEVNHSLSEGALADNIEVEDGPVSDRQYLERMTRLLGEDSFYDEEANARIVFGTLRSGQRVETPYTLVVIGDVNPGADLVAGGDIIIVGSLRGTAHAAAYDDDAFDRVIIAFKMQPMQLRIGSVISRGNGEAVSGAEIARIENRRIVVETFNSKAWFGNRYRSR